MYVFSAAAVSAAAAEEEARRRIIKLYVKLKHKKGGTGMDKETMLALIGRDIVVTNIFGSAVRGTVLSASDGAVEIKTRGGETVLVALDYIVKAVVKN